MFALARCDHPKQAKLSVIGWSGAVLVKYRHGVVGKVLGPEMQAEIRLF